jgi:hypothetical protein
LIARISDLSALQRRVLVMVVRDREPATRVAVATGLPVDAVRRHLVAALRAVADVGTPAKQDPLMGEYLLLDGSITARDGVARSLWELGVRPVELHQLETAYNALRAAPAKAWASTVVDEGRDLPPPPWPISESERALLEEAIRHDVPRQDLATRLGVPPREIDRRVVGALRSIAGRRDSNQTDALIAAFLLDSSDAPPARQLWAAGVDPLEVHQLELTLSAIQSLPKDRWQTITIQPEN